MNKKAFFNWSGGKDSSFALYKILKEKEYSVEYLLTTISEKYQRISMHGVREVLLDLQAKNIGFPLEKVYLPETASMQVYEDAIGCKMIALKEQQIDYAIFGDIFLEDLRQYREEQLKKVGMNAVFPVWKIDTRDLVNNFINLGFKAIVVSVDCRYLDQSFAGALLDYDFINRLPENIDPCGENGEFHSFVFDGPIFKEPVEFIVGEKVYREYPSHSNNSSDVKETNGFWFCDLLPR